jgi:hypothetical protein
MADYILRDGKGTKVREDSNLLEGYVDMNVVNLDDISGSPSNTDMVAIQKAGATAPVKTSLLSLKSVLGDGPAPVFTSGVYGAGSIKTNAATATGLRSGDEAKPYVYWRALAGQDLKAGGLAGTDQKWMLISPSTVATYAYAGVEYTYNNATANYVFLILIDSADFIGSATSPFNICRIIANAGTNHLFNYRTILTVGSPITGNVYPVIVSTGSSTAPSGITYTESVSLYAPLKSSSTNYNGNFSVASGNNSVASGSSSVASGYSSVAAGHSSVASGRFSVASGFASVASGYSSVASGDSSVASGYSSVAAGHSSVASGRFSVASGFASVASGTNSVASGEHSVASGLFSEASGSNSVASGLLSEASGNYSVASGRESEASGSNSVASGLLSEASGNYSVASGRASVASGEGSVASGYYSRASGASQTVIGKYNVANTSSAFIIGNGTSTSARSNCLTVSFNGEIASASLADGALGAGEKNEICVNSEGVIMKLPSGGLRRKKIVSLVEANFDSGTVSKVLPHVKGNDTTFICDFYSGSAVLKIKVPTALNSAVGDTMEILFIKNSASSELVTLEFYGNAGAYLFSPESEVPLAKATATLTSHLKLVYTSTDKWVAFKTDYAS